MVSQPNYSFLAHWKLTSILKVTPPEWLTTLPLESEVEHNHSYERLWWSMSCYQVALLWFQPTRDHPLDWNCAILTSGPPNRIPLLDFVGHTFLLSLWAFCFLLFLAYCLCLFNISSRAGLFLSFLSYWSLQQRVASFIFLLHLFKLLHVIFTWARYSHVLTANVFSLPADSSCSTTQLSRFLRVCHDWSQAYN